MIADRIMVELAIEPEATIRQVRAVRPGAIETPAQKIYVLGVSAKLYRHRETFMDWFETLTGFRESSYEETRTRLQIEGGQLRSLVNGASYATGQLDLVSLQALRDKAGNVVGPAGRLKLQVVKGDVRYMHQSRDTACALFQVASQFNLLEMVSPTISPEQGVTRYQSDATQGPACAIAAGAATIFRNYFVPFDGGQGQTARRQLNGLADLGTTLSHALDMPLSDLWEMQNGYALATRIGLDAIARHLATLSADQTDILRGQLRIGLLTDAEATEATGPDRPLVSQAFCSALPVACGRVPVVHWQSFACLVLEAAYEATLWAAVLNAQRGASKIVFLTLLGGGAFGNQPNWIQDAMRRSLDLMSSYDLDVRLVSYGPPPTWMLDMAKGFR